jgi:hypothetical protein
MAVAIVEKLLNMVGWSLPFVDVFPRQLVDWAVALLVFEIALSLRQLVDMVLESRQGPEPQPRPDAN